jgi:hypothetical protein
MVAASQVALVDRAVLFTPVRKLNEAILLWYIWNRTKDRPTCVLYVNTMSSRRRFYTHVGRSGRSRTYPLVPEAFSDQLVPFDFETL